MPDQAQGRLSEAQRKIIWCSWQIVSLMSIAVGASFALAASMSVLPQNAEISIWMITLLLAAIIILIGARIKYSDWAVLLMVSAMLAFKIIQCETSSKKWRV